MESLEQIPRADAGGGGVLFQRPSPSSYFCLLDEQPTFLVPPRLLRNRFRSTTRSLVVNPLCWFSRDGSPPPQVAPWLSSLADAFPQAESVWVSNSATGSIAPFWLGPGLSDLLARAQPGQPAPAGLDPRQQEILWRARILIEDGDAAREREEWASTVEHGRRQFARGYLPLAGLVHPYHLGALRRYFRHHIRKGNFALGDNQSGRRYVAHNENVARFFHHQLAATISQMAGEVVKPSYVYFASYQDGAVLEKHTDRQQCEFSITFCLDYTPEPAGATGWPIRLEAKSGRVTVHQAIGDALLYRGCQVPHFRKPLPPGATSTSFFFHYVRADFAGPLD